MNNNLECLIIGLISIICCHFLYHYIYTKQKNKKTNNKYYKHYLLLSFLFGYLLHYIMKNNNIEDIYCKKVCYGDECFLICPVNNM